jgi:hypothetical protein
VKVRLSEDSWAAIIGVSRTAKIQGNLLKMLDPGDSEAAAEYLRQAIAEDKDRNRKRLDITRRVQSQNADLTAAQERNEALVNELRQAAEAAEEARTEAEQARAEAERARDDIEHELDYMQKRTQFELMGRIVRVALVIIVGVGTVTTAMYATALFTAVAPSDVTLLGNTWSNMLGILLTNSFSIVATIMGIKHVTDSSG